MILNHFQRHGILTKLHNGVQNILYVVAMKQIKTISVMFRTLHHCQSSTVRLKLPMRAFTVHGAIALAVCESCSGRHTCRVSALNFQLQARARARAHTHTHTHTHTHVSKMSVTEGSYAARQYILSFKLQKVVGSVIFLWHLSALSTLLSEHNAIINSHRTRSTRISSIIMDPS